MQTLSSTVPSEKVPEVLGVVHMVIPGASAHVCESVYDLLGIGIESGLAGPI